MFLNQKYFASQSLDTITIACFLVSVYFFMFSCLLKNCCLSSIVLILMQIIITAAVFPGFQSISLLLPAAGHWKCFLYSILISVTGSNSGIEPCSSQRYHRQWFPHHADIMKKTTPILIKIRFRQCSGGWDTSIRPPPS